MIVNKENHIELKFGTGDINILPGHIDDMGIVGFRNQTARDIGFKNGDKPNEITSIEQLPVVMTFDKPESIDVVIYSLIEAKRLISFKCEDRKEDMCSSRDYGMNKYKNPCYKCCHGCTHALEMTCSMVCPDVAELYHPEEESENEIINDDGSEC